MGAGGRGTRATVLLAALALGAAACSLSDPGDAAGRPPGSVTLAFAGDVHFEGGVEALLDSDESTMGPLARSLAAADLSVVNLETSITTRGERADKELEDPTNRFWFRAPASALGVLERSGVDIASVANNHGADYGVQGIRDTLAAGAASTVELIGIGEDAEQAFAPHRATVRGTTVAVHAADASPLESEDPTWSARPGSGPGIADARGEGLERLVAQVRTSAERDDLVVVYLHWGAEGRADPTAEQAELAAVLSEAGADVVVGAHAHVPLGSGTIEVDGRATYVNYGLGNVLWYHGDNAETGVLELTVQDGEVVQDAWVPGGIPPEGGPARVLEGDEARSAVKSWKGLRARTDLQALAGSEVVEPPTELPAFTSEIRRIDPATRERMTSHDESVCPVSLTSLRLVEVPYVGFDGFVHEGEVVVHEDVARDVVNVFAAMYRTGFPLQSVRLIDEFGGDDNRSMAANNSSGYNCRRVAGSDAWSAHAYGRAVDVNPVQNPYVLDGRALPPASQPFVDVDRSVGAASDQGVITTDGPVARAFARIGWTWGADFEEPDYQHFAAPDPRRP